MGKGDFLEGFVDCLGGNTMGLFQGLLLGHPAQGLAVLNRIFGVSTLDSPRDYRDSPPSVLTLQMLRHFIFRV